MAGFKRDPVTGDLDLTDGLKIVTGVDELIQRIQLGLTINLGEFFTHANSGLPWLKDESNPASTDIEYFLGGNIQLAAQVIVKEFDNYIESIDQVDSVTSTFEFNPLTRTLSYLPNIIANNGEAVNFPPYIKII